MPEAERGMCFNGGVNWLIDWLKLSAANEDKCQQFEIPKQLCKDCRMFDDKWIAGFCHICQCQPDMTTEEILNKHFTNG